MSGPKWTPAQKAAIEDRGGSLLVSAAAGSGKTAVLTQRAVQLITDPEHPVDADRLLIVTFTNAAAAELRARIGQALLQLSSQQPGNTSLRRQRMLLQRAPICTIDAFCLDLLHKHFQALDIPPDFAPADPGTVEVLRAAAVAETMENACRDPDFCAFADLYGKGRTDKPAEKTLLHLYDFLRAMPDYDRKLEEFLEPWQRENGFASTCWHHLLLEQAAQCAGAARELLGAAMTDCEADFVQELDKVQEKKTAAAQKKVLDAVSEKYDDVQGRLKRSAALLEEVERLAKAGQWTPLYDRLTPFVLGMEETPGLKGMKRRLSGDHKTAIRTRADAATDLFEQITALICCSEAEAEQDRQAALPRLRALFAAVRDFDARFAAKKRERKVLEFSDFEHMALRLLRDEKGNPTPLCQNIRSNYAAVMVDEYQDTNALQDALYRCLASPAGDDLFLVGDLKQSIYRFRQADPGIFRAKLESWKPLPGQQPRPRLPEGVDGTDALLALDANFRSAPQVVAGINFLFEQLMTPRLGDTVYGEGQRLVCGAPGEYEGAVEVQFLPDNDPKTDAGWIADRIRELVKAGTPVREGSTTRPVQYGDCCVLLAARGEFATYVEALTEKNIPVYADTRENLMTAPHIRPLISLLRVIDNPAQDIHLAAAMLGPVFGFTDDDLVRLRAYSNAVRKAQSPDRKPERMSLYGAVLLAAEDGDEETPFTRKVRQFYRQLTALRQLARSVPAEQLIEEIFASTGYLSALGAMENGAHRREDARRFAAFCAQSGANGISALVRAIDAATAAGSTGQDTAPGGARPGCVTIMTIHRSKGLQFPVVFVANTGRRFNETDLYQPVLLHREYGAGLRLRAEEGGDAYKTAAYTALAMVHGQELRSEQMRLLYVALTRAQDRLILTVPVSNSPSARPFGRAAAFLAAGAGETLHRQGSCFADWLRAALLVHPDGGVLRKLAGELELPFVPTDSRMDIKVWGYTPQLTFELGDTEEEPPAPDPELVQRLRQGFAWQYPGAALSALPAKVSVTGIVHGSRPATLERPAFLSKDGLTAAEMGTALHSFLEHADFAALAAAQAQGRLEEAIRAERDRQTAAKLTAPEVAAKLDMTRIARFVDSEAFRRICGAQQLLREYAFITALSAAEVTAAQGGDGTAAPDAEVLVQGIADLVLVYPDHLELLDYKTDRRKTEEQLRQDYHAQLELYARALDRRFTPRKVTYKAIYSLELGKLIEV